MSTRAGTAPVDGRRPEPLFSVFVDYETFAGRLCAMADGAVVSPGSLIEHLDDGWVERVVFDGPSRVMDLGAATRLFAGATRRAIQLRDRECFHELCDIPAKRCEVDHIEPWGAGGQTIQKNGRLACGFHNRARHRKRKRPPP
ncbi:MAG TPA: HNH endonuclease signature motif containing protein [Acidimicrobiales bacterium]|nr:HNH endonuclease signature motif containing protein [Acidimicrobiales bacterium]